MKLGNKVIAGNPDNPRERQNDQYWIIENCVCYQNEKNITCKVNDFLEIFKDCTWVWQIYEPKPYKDGDWVEILVVSNNIELTEQRKVVDVADDGYALNQPYSNLNHLDWIGWDNVPIQKHTGIIKVLRKLQPSEVKVKITLEGTVKPADKHGFYIGTNYVLYSHCTPVDAALVRELVEEK